jgi:CubicO group peptidase (beta-lactamase class C family)
MDKLALAVLLSAPAAPLCSQTATDFAPVEQAARQELARMNVPSASIAIVRAGEVVFAKALGWPAWKRANRFGPRCCSAWVPPPRCSPPRR